MAKIDSHNRTLYHLLLNGKSITNADALFHYGIGRLASRICDLTKIYSVPIQREWEPNSDGEGRHMRYSMPAEMRERLKNIPLEKVCTIYKGGQA